VRGQCRRQLEQCERVARGFAQQPPADCRAELGEVLAQQLVGGVRVERRQLALLDVDAAEQRAGPRPGAGQESQGQPLHPPGEEEEHLGTRPVDPVEVVDHDEHRRSRRGDLQQPQGGRRHHEPVGRLALA